MACDLTNEDTYRVTSGNAVRMLASNSKNPIQNVKTLLKHCFHLMEVLPFGEHKILIKMSVPTHTPKCVGDTILRGNFPLVKRLLSHMTLMSFFPLCPLFVSVVYQWDGSCRISVSHQDRTCPFLPCIVKSLCYPYEGRNIWKEREAEVFWTVTEAVALGRISKTHAQALKAKKLLRVWDNLYMMAHIDVPSFSSIKKFIEY